jgi:hypothetical protein
VSSFSVIVTAHNNAAVLARTLHSVEDALAHHAAHTPSFRTREAEGTCGGPESCGTAFAARRP